MAGKRKRKVPQNEEISTNRKRMARACKGRMISKVAEDEPEKEENRIDRERKTSVSKGKGKRKGDQDEHEKEETRIDRERKTSVSKRKGKQKGDEDEPENETNSREENDSGDEEAEVEGEDKNDSDEEEDEVERFEFEVNEEIEGFDHEAHMGRREIPDSSDEEDNEDPMIKRQRRLMRRSDDRIGLGKSFMNGTDFKDAVLDYALKTGNNVKQGRWEKTKLEFICGIGGNCKWRVYCSWDEPSKVWLVKTTYPWHSCTQNGRCKLLKSPVIARLFMDKLRNNPNFMPLDIQQHIKDKWKFVSSGGQCQRGRSLALKMLEKEYARQFAHIRGYIEEIKYTNPGSTVIVDTIPNVKGEDVFDRFYVCIEKIRSSWAGTCRMIVGLDGTFLKVAVKGCLLTAVGHDANNQIYPLAWVVVQSENGPNWLWFMQHLKKDLYMGDGSSFVILSDRSKGLKSAVKAEVPRAEHRMCVKHIVENLKKNHVGKDMLKPLIWSLAWSYHPTEYEENLQKIRDYNISLYNDVMKEDPKSWTLAFYRIGSCCEKVDNNATESFNSTITKARAKAIIPMLETIRRQAMQRIAKRSKQSKDHEGRFSEYVMKILAAEKDDADRCVTYSSSHGMYEVVLDGNSYQVNLPKGTCSCCKWQISRIPCEHAYGAVIDIKKDVEDYVSGFFSTDMWRDLYVDGPVPLRGPRFWMKPTYKLVVAPEEPQLPGRKKIIKKRSFPRIKSKHESPQKKVKQSLGRGGRTIHCSSCREAGHNAAGCKKFPKKKTKKNKSVQQGGTSTQEQEEVMVTQPTQSTQ